MECFLIILPKGSMYKVNKSGPSTEPCGTPSLTLINTAKHEFHFMIKLNKNPRKEKKKELTGMFSNSSVVEEVPLEHLAVSSNFVCCLAI